MALSIGRYSTPRRLTVCSSYVALYITRALPTITHSMFLVPIRTHQDEFRRSRSDRLCDAAADETRSASDTETATEDETRKNGSGSGGDEDIEARGCQSDGATDNKRERCFFSRNKSGLTRTRAFRSVRPELLRTYGLGRYFKDESGDGGVSRTVPFSLLGPLGRSDYDARDVKSEQLVADVQNVERPTETGVGVRQDSVGKHKGDIHKHVANVVTSVAEIFGGSKRLSREERLQLLATELHTYATKHRTLVYKSSVCAASDVQSASAIAAELAELSVKYATDQFRLVSVHGDHVHVVHLCTYSNASCRCAWLKTSTAYRTTVVKRTKFRRRIFGSDLKHSDWESVVRYFTTNGHVVEEDVSRGGNGRLYIRFKGIQVSSTLYRYDVDTH